MTTPNGDSGGRTDRVQTFVVAALLALFLVNGAFSVYHDTATTDEQNHYRYGMRLLNGSAERYDGSSMPMSMLNALPGKFATYLPQGPLHVFLGELFAARMMTLLFSALVAAAVYFWARSLYGFVPALAALILYTFDPNILAHSQRVTTDLYATGTILLAFFFLWRFARVRTWQNGVLAGAALGLSQIAKYTSAPVLMLSVFALFVGDLVPALRARSEGAWAAIRRVIVRCLLYAAGGLALALLVINAAFLFDRTFTRFRDYTFRWDVLKAAQADHPLLAALPVPAPYAYLEGLDWVVQLESSGVGHGRLYLLGRLSDGKGFTGYYFVASLLKVPIATQIVIWTALAVYLIDPKRRRRFFADEIFIFVPVVFFAIYFNFFYNSELGIRHFLVVFPLLYVFAGSLFVNWNDLSRRKKGEAFALAAFLIGSVLSFFPHYLPYFNEIVWDRTQAYRYLADSNIDWGQSRNELEQYLKQHPEAQYADPSDPRWMAAPHAGHIVVSVNKLVGVTSNPANYAWLRENFRPSGTVAYEYLVYRISDEQIAALCATTDYCQ